VELNSTPSTWYASSAGHLENCVFGVDCSAGVIFKHEKCLSLILYSLTILNSNVDLIKYSFVQDGFTALHHAAARNQARIVERLIDAGLDVKALTKVISINRQ
jgi:ankyrin repeat protein